MNVINRLSTFFGGLLTSNRLTYGEATDAGRRSENMDAMETYSGITGWVPFGIFVVADGMGHHGHRASSLAAQVSVDQLASKIRNPKHFALWLQATSWREKSSLMEDMLVETVQLVHHELTEQEPKGQTGLTAVVIREGVLYCVRVGNSDAFLIDNTGIRCLSRDLSIDRYRDKDGNWIDFCSVPTALGKDELRVDFFLSDLPPTSRLLLCSDGLWGVVSHETILQIIERTDDVQDACDRLVVAARQAGGRDSITAILIKMPA